MYVALDGMHRAVVGAVDAERAAGGDADDVPRSGQYRALDDVHADTAAATDENGIGWRDRRRVEDRTKPRCHSATEKCRKR